MSEKKDEAALTTEDMSLTPAQIVSQGMLVVLPGDVYEAVVEMFDMLLKAATMDEGARTVMVNIRDNLRVRAVPVRARGRSIIMPGDPG